MPEIVAELAGRNALERRRIKAQRLAENAAARLPVSWSIGKGRDRLLITVAAASFDGNDLRLRVAAGAYADDVIIRNPPVMVPTGNVNADGSPVYVYDPVNALRIMVEDVVGIWQRAGLL